jgi:hypothetical protein
MPIEGSTTSFSAFFFLLRQKGNLIMRDALLLFHRVLSPFSLHYYKMVTVTISSSVPIFFFQ